MQLYPMLCLYRRALRCGADGAGAYRGGRSITEAYVPWGTPGMAAALYIDDSFPKAVGPFGANPSSMGRVTVKHGIGLAAQFAAGVVPQDLGACPHWDVEELVAPGPDDGERPGLARDGGDVANILYTSGTTGQPKGVMQTHGNLAFNAGTVASVFGVTGADRTLVVAPLFHATGIVSQLVGFGVHGAACVFQPRFQVTRMREALMTHRITFFWAERDCSSSPSRGRR